MLLIDDIDDKLLDEFMRLLNEVIQQVNISSRGKLLILYTIKKISERNCVIFDTDPRVSTISGRMSLTLAF